MQAPELPPFDYQLVKGRTTKEPATGAGELSGCGIIAWQRRFVWSDDPFFSVSVPPRNQMPTFCWMYWIEGLAPSEIIRVPTSQLKNSTTTHAQPDVDAIHGRGGARIAIG